MCDKASSGELRGRAKGGCRLTCPVHGDFLADDAAHRSAGHTLVNSGLVPGFLDMLEVPDVEVAVMVDEESVRLIGCDVSAVVPPPDGGAGRLDATSEHRLRVRFDDRRLRLLNETRSLV